MQKHCIAKSIPPELTLLDFTTFQNVHHAGCAPQFQPDHHCLRYRDDSCSINNLPNELLSKIFSATVAAENMWQDPWKLPSPTLLSSVCSHWRIVAQSTPELWVNINVRLCKWPEDTVRWTAEWIARAGILPISVMIDDRTGTSMLCDWNIIMFLLSQHSERLRHLALHSRSSAPIEKALSLLRPAPNLQQLTIDCDGWFPEVEVHGQWQYSLKFPRLTTLKLEGAIIPPIPNLTSLTIGQLYASYHTISQYFTSSPGLQHLTLYNLKPSLPPPPHAALIQADSLRSLAVNLVAWGLLPQEEESHILQYLAMPNVKYLEINGDDWTVSNFGQSLSFAELDTLRISYRFSLSADTINFLHSFSTIRHLQLVCTSTQGLLSKSRRGLTRHNFRSRSRRTAPVNLDITSSTEQNQSVSTSVWPELRIITLDTLAVDDVLNLCNFVTSHKQLQVVELSTAARLHLSSLRRKGNRVYQCHSFNKEGLDDVEEWLGKMVDIRTLLSPSVGLLDAD